MMIVLAALVVIVALVELVLPNRAPEQTIDMTKVYENMRKRAEENDALWAQYR